VEIPLPYAISKGDGLCITSKGGTRRSVSLDLAGHQSGVRDPLLHVPPRVWNLCNILPTPVLGHSTTVTTAFLHFLFFHQPTMATMLVFSPLHTTFMAEVAHGNNQQFFLPFSVSPVDFQGWLSHPKETAYTDTADPIRSHARVQGCVDIPALQAYRLPLTGLSRATLVIALTILPRSRFTSLLVVDL
jgi:hypothetical protein